MLNQQQARLVPSFGLSLRHDRPSPLNPVTVRSIVTFIVD